MQLKIEINGIEKFTLSSFTKNNLDDLNALIDLFGGLLPDKTIKVHLSDEEKMKCYLVYKQNKEL